MAVDEAHLKSLVQHSERGDAAARNVLFATLYDELRRLARREAVRYGALPSLGGTELLHELYKNLEGGAQPVFHNKAHFMGYAVRAMRGLVIDHLRSRKAAKRGGGVDITSLNTEKAERAGSAEDLQWISDALDELAQHEPALAYLVDLRFFCGFSMIEISDMTGVSPRQAQRQWEKAQMLLYRALKR